MKEKISKRKKVIITILVVCALIAVAGITYAFITQVLTGEKQVVINAGVLDLVLEEENAITISDALPMYDQVGMIQEDVFEFRLVNKTSNPTDYVLKLDDITPLTMETEHKCSELGEITLDSPIECRKTDYPAELRSEALTICKDWYPEVTTEEQCITANIINEGVPLNTFEDFIELLVYTGDLEDTRTLVETYPDNYILREFPKLDKYNVKYYLTKEGIGTPALLSSLPDDGTVDFGTIAGNDTIDYTLRFWIDSEVTDENAISGKALSYKIDVETRQSIELTQECFDYEISEYIVNDYNACANYMIENANEDDYDAFKMCAEIVTDVSELKKYYETEFQGMLTEGIIQKGNEAVITGYNCTSDIIEIPDTIEVDVNGLNPVNTEKLKVTVSAIGNKAFSNYETVSNSDDNNISAKPMGMSLVNNLHKVTIPDTVKFIHESAFADISLKEIELSDNLLFIDSHAFAENYLKTVKLPDNLIYIGESSFCDNILSEIILPDSLNYLGGGVFSHNQLKSVKIPKKITSIPPYTFSYNHLEELYLPEGVTEIGSDAFYSNHLEELYLPEGVTRIETYAFAYNNLKTVTIPNTVEYLGVSIFNENPNLSNIINKTSLEFDWATICFGIWGEPSFITGTTTNGIQTITITSE